MNACFDKRCSSESRSCFSLAVRSARTSTCLRISRRGTFCIHLSMDSMEILKALSLRKPVCMSSRATARQGTRAPMSSEDAWARTQMRCSMICAGSSFVGRPAICSIRPGALCSSLLLSPQRISQTRVTKASQTLAPSAPSSALFTRPPTSSASEALITVMFSSSRAVSVLALGAGGTPLKPCCPPRASFPTRAPPESPRLTRYAGMSRCRDFGPPLVVASCGSFGAELE
mmetsp:Transcript_51087/g.150639  ORF Transcript_51087/g.150639 Transcript_51087/m.150639 type:complete len:230 (-) Transcript_51087:270-959(-)